MDFTTEPIRVGTVVYTSWGYDQTQVDFFEVIALTPSGKSARVQRCGVADQAGAGDPHRSLVPKDVDPEAEVTTHKILDDGKALKIRGHYAWRWDGRPKYATGFGYGH